MPGRSDYSTGDLLEPPSAPPWLSPRLGAVDEQAVSESVCQWCGRQISSTDVVCTGCGAPVTHGAPDPKPAPARPAPPAPGAAARPQAAAATAQRTAAPPSKNVHTAKAVSLIASAVSAGEAGVIIRFFTPQGQLITEIRPGSPAYDEALRLALG